MRGKVFLPRIVNCVKRLRMYLRLRSRLGEVDHAQVQWLGMVSAAAEFVNPADELACRIRTRYDHVIIVDSRRNREIFHKLDRYSSFSNRLLPPGAM